MRNIIRFMLATVILFGCESQLGSSVRAKIETKQSKNNNPDYQINYDEMIMLDAENLAEQGILEAYEEVKTYLKKYVEEPALLEEVMDKNSDSYKVSSEEFIYEVYGPDKEVEHSWGRATYALFRIVNKQLEHLDIRFYAINAGNDLGGIFLSSDESLLAKESLPRKLDWPYIPTQEAPWFGQYH